MADYYVPTFEEIDTAIHNLLTTIKVDGKPITVTTNFPHHEGLSDKDTIPPAIGFHRIDIMHDITREQSDITLIHSETDDKVTLQDVPVPVKYIYELTLISYYMTDLNVLEYELMKIFQPRGYLIVPTPQGDLAYDFLLKSVIPGDNYGKTENGGATSDKVLYRRKYRYHLLGEQEAYKLEEYYKVHTVDPTVIKQ